ncbi:hypothetical protein CEXT_258681 [Caerostris extrusa]|uniref:Uncharacterized protein n=1 Tax=Caerostris extrusa TaxID=172846 RepID=A0AAV4M327_CAEEX|nr:hypothetical protein CEXT_258681 [Caerostris extrusa]
MPTKVVLDGVKSTETNGVICTVDGICTTTLLLEIQPSARAIATTFSSKSDDDMDSLFVGQVQMLENKGSHSHVAAGERTYISSIIGRWDVCEK